MYTVVNKENKAKKKAKTKQKHHSDSVLHNLFFTSVWSIRVS